VVGDNKIYVGILTYRYKMAKGDSQTGDNRVLRGGSWNNNGRNCRSANRNNNEPDNANNNIGFRLARAQHAVGMSVIDQTFIQTGRGSNRLAKNKAASCASNDRGRLVNAHWWAALTVQFCHGF
jgi:hypothetical protein